MLRYLRDRVGTRLLLVSATVCSFILAGAAIAIAAYPQDSVTLYTGCLTTSGTSSGNIGSVAVGSNPAKACGQNQVLIHLSGGTITQVSAGTGLSGGGNNGYVTVGVKPSYQLPQTGCSSGQFVASDGAGGWSCQSQKTYSGTNFALSNQSCDTGQFLTGFDSSGLKKCANDQTYSNGTGLDLSGNTFSLTSGYKLPQGCSSGQVASSDGNNSWTCQTTGAAEGVSDLTDYTKYWTVSLGDDDTQTASQYCASGDIATGGGWHTDGDASIVNSGPASSNGYEGWSATASTPFRAGFASGYVTVYVKCLTSLH